MLLTDFPLTHELACRVLHIDPIEPGPDLADAHSADVDQVSELEIQLQRCQSCRRLADCDAWERGFSTRDAPGWLGVPKPRRHEFPPGEEWTIIEWFAMPCRHLAASEGRVVREKGLRRANIGKRYWGAAFDGYERFPGVSAALDRAMRYVERREWEQGRGLIFVGPTDLGKTMLASAILQEARKLGVHAMTLRASQLRPTKETDEDGKYHWVDDPACKEALTVDLLLLDDLGTEGKAEWVREAVENLIDERYQNQLATLVTANIKPDEFVPQTKESDETRRRHESAVSDRMRTRFGHMADVVVMKGPPFQTHRTSHESPKGKAKT